MAAVLVATVFRVLVGRNPERLRPAGQRAAAWGEASRRRAGGHRSPCGSLSGLP